MNRVYIGNARISEHGTVNGTRGDQTGREVMIQPWSQGGFWQYVFRPKSEAKAKKIAAAMAAACNNPNIGYSQRDRLSLDNLASKNGYKLDKVGKCNCDCTSLGAVCVNAAGIKVSPSMWSGNAHQLLSATGQFTIFTSTSYTHAETKLRAGDILLRQGHMAIVTSGAVPFTQTTSTRTTKKKSTTAIAKEIIAGKCSDSRWKTWGYAPIRGRRLKKAGYTKAERKKIQDKVNELMRGN